MDLKNEKYKKVERRRKETDTKIFFLLFHVWNSCWVSKKQA
jgi:hypothetical protein